MFTLPFLAARKIRESWHHAASESRSPLTLKRLLSETLENKLESDHRWMKVQVNSDRTKLSL